MLLSFILAESSLSWQKGEMTIMPSKVNCKNALTNTTKQPGLAHSLRPRAYNRGGASIMTEPTWNASLARLRQEVSKTRSHRHGVLCWYEENGNAIPFPTEDASSLCAPHQVTAHQRRRHWRKEGVPV